MLGTPPEGRSANESPNHRGTCADWMRVSREHRLDPMPSHLGQIGVINACGVEVGDIAVAALVGADV